jgi:hypothetical protein
MDKEVQKKAAENKKIIANYQHKGTDWNAT